MRRLRIYTDGAFSFERKQGGVGVVFVKEEDGDRKSKPKIGRAHRARSEEHTP